MVDSNSRFKRRRSTFIASAEANLVVRYNHAGRMTFAPSLDALRARMMNTAWVTSFAICASPTWRSAVEYTR